MNRWRRMMSGRDELRRYIVSIPDENDGWDPFPGLDFHQVLL